MANGVNAAHWDTTSHLLALIRNRYAKRGTPPVTAAQCNPFRQPQRRNDLNQSLLKLKPHIIGQQQAIRKEPQP